MKLSCVVLILTWSIMSDRDVFGSILTNVNQSQVTLNVDGNNLVLYNNNAKSWLQMVLVFTREPHDNQSTPLIEDKPCNASGAATTKGPEITAAPTTKGPEITAAAIAKGPDNSIVCKDGFIQLESNKCYFFSREWLNWNDALRFCESKGTTLAHPMNEHENTALVNYLNNYSTTYYYWLGGSDEAKEGEWVWAHNKAPIMYTDWLQGQPDDSGHSENCLLIWDSHDWKWNDYSCDNDNKFICQQ